MARAGLVLAVVGMVTVGWGTPAFAHEQRQVGGYQFTVGWANEPTYAGVLNAVQLVVKDAKGNPIDDLGSPPSLQVTISTGTQTSDPLSLQASFDPDTGNGTHGQFDAAILPTAAGSYTFHFTGTVNGQKVDEKFTSSDKTFDDVHEPTDVEFPAKPPALATLSTNLERLNPRVDNAVSVAQASQAAARSAKHAASTATALAWIALATGLVLGGTGVVVAVTGRRGKA